jgi:hypothetical protein
LRDQFSELSARFELVNRRTPKGRRFSSLLEAWNKRAREYLPSAVDLNDAIIDSNAWKAFINASGDFASSEFAKAVGAAQSGNDQEQAKRVLKEKLLAALNAALEEPAVKAAVKPAPATAEAYWQQVKANRHIFNQINHAWTASLEYALERPAIATEAIGDVVPEGVRPPDLHTVRLVAAKGLPRANLDFTVNVSSSWFGDARVMNKGNWRDFRVGAEGRLLLKQIPDFGRPVVTFAGLWMHLNQEPLGLGIQVFNEAKINQPGNIRLFQAKLEVPTANAAVKIPLSFTYANRTELVKESDVRGQIGITLDLDTFFGN